MNMNYILKYYKVPAKVGMSVIACGQKGMIVGAKNAYLRIKIDEGNKIRLYLSTWEMKHLGPLEGK